MSLGASRKRVQSCIGFLYTHRLPLRQRWTRWPRQWHRPIRPSENLCMFVSRVVGWRKMTTLTLAPSFPRWSWEVWSVRWRCTICWGRRWNMQCMMLTWPGRRSRWDYHQPTLLQCLTWTMGADRSQQDASVRRKMRQPGGPKWM